MTEWISVKDGLPESSVQLWVYGRFWDGVDFRKKRQVGIGAKDPQGGWWDFYDDKIDAVTHYRAYEKPEPPEAAP